MDQSVHPLSRPPPVGATATERGVTMSDPTPGGYDPQNPPTRRYGQPPVPPQLSLIHLSEAPTPRVGA